VRRRRGWGRGVAGGGRGWPDDRVWRGAQSERPQSAGCLPHCCGRGRCRLRVTASLSSFSPSRCGLWTWHSLQVVLYSLSVRVRGRQMHSDRTTCYAWGPSPPPHVEPDLCTAGSSWVPWWHAMLHSVALSSLARMVCLLPSPRLFCLLPVLFVRAVDASCHAVATAAAGLVIKDASAPLHRRLGCPHPQRADLAINKRPAHQF